MLCAHLLEHDGVQIELDSIYRSLSEQQDIWDIATRGFTLEEYMAENPA
ncbi:hypothetical protein IJI17_02410 [Candidatus Saccharibacteria bacterium]|nr:hypothetical protein [Candidatus Saccharibacteria bacterium]